MRDAEIPGSVPRLIVLDGLRGIAAIAVLLVHCASLIGDYLPRGYLAVDFFFLLSGAVLERRYGAGLRGGLPVRDFMRARLARLYPLYCIGALLGLLALIASSNGTYGREQLLLAAVLGLLVLPFPWTQGFAPAWLILPPGWSLFFELVANAVYASLARILTARVLCCLVAMGVFLLFEEAREWGRLNVGWNLITIDGAVGRVLFSFFLGVSIARLPPLRSGPVTSPIVPVALAAILLACTAIPHSDPSNGFIGCAIVIIVWPALLVVALNCAPGGSLAAICRKLGTLSYPLYVLHFPWLILMRHSFATDQRFMAFGEFERLVLVVGMPLVLAILGAWWDEARRRRLSESSRPQGASVAAADWPDLVADQSSAPVPSQT